MNRKEAEGPTDEAKGKVREAAGKVSGDESAKGKGKADKHGGNDETVLGKINDDGKKEK